MQFNIARGVGPAIGGIIVSALGAGFAFLANALSFVGVTGVLISWRRQAHKSVLPAERVYCGIRAGLRYVRYSPVLRAVLVRSFLFGLGTSAMWAVLPLAARVEFHTDAAGYGLIVAFFGVGAAACGFGRRCFAGCFRVTGSGCAAGLHSRSQTQRLPRPIMSTCFGLRLSSLVRHG